MQCIIMENTLIKLTLHDETKKRKACLSAFTFLAFGFLAHVS